jgi:hypothetical protein
MSDWATTVPGDSTWATIENQYIKKYRFVVTWGLVARQSAIQHIVTKEYDGVTQAAADSYVAAHFDDTNTSVKSVRSNSAAGYKVIKTVDSTSAYSSDPEPT